MGNGNVCPSYWRNCGTVLDPSVRLAICSHLFFQPLFVASSVMGWNEERNKWGITEHHPLHMRFFIFLLENQRSRSLADDVAGFSERSVASASINWLGGHSFTGLHVDFYCPGDFDPGSFSNCVTMKQGRVLRQLMEPTRMAVMRSI